MKVDGSLKSLLQGVSQQPPRDRLPGQGALQENMSSDPLSGLTRRPPTDLVGYLGTSDNVRGWHNFETEDGRKFLAFVHDQDVQVFDLNANEQPVEVDDIARAYLNAPDGMRFSTIENSTYVVNRSMRPSMTSKVASYFNSPASPAGLVQVLGGQYGRSYQVIVDGTVRASFTCPDGSSPGHINEVRTTFIAQQLTSQLSSNLSGWTVVRREDIILVRKPSSGQFTLIVNDDAGNQNIKSCTTQVAGIEDLPRNAPHLYVVRVAEKTDPDQDLFFKFIVEGQEAELTPSQSLFGQPGYWQECVAPNTPVQINDGSMPHMLEYDADTQSFDFRRVSWAERRVGTTVSNPNPTFIGLPIQDVYTFQGRLGFLAGPNVIMSRQNRNHDFWFGSASAQASTDPIDVFSKVEASVMLAAVQHNRDLVIFSNKGQFVMFGRNFLTPDTAALVLTTAFEAELRAKPVAAGRNVFFANNYGAFTGIREFYAEGGTEINDSRPISQHVKRYIRGKVVNLAASSNYDTLLVHTDHSGREVYVYQYIWADNEKVQSAWHKWILSHPVVHSFFDEEVVYFVIKVGNDYYLKRMSLDVQDSAGVEYPAVLDTRFDVFDCYSAFVLPYAFLADGQLVCVQGENCPTPGLPVPIDSITYEPEHDGWVVRLRKNMLGGNIVIGSRFKSRYMPTMPFVKDQDGVAIATGTLRLRALLVSLLRTGHIAGQVRSKYGDGPVVDFDGRVVGDIDNVVGEQPLSDATFTMPFRQNAQLADVEFFTDSHLPMTLLDIEWVGQYNKRGRRIATGE